MMMLAFAGILTILLLLVVVYDATQFIIPNEINIGFLIIYPAFLIMTPAHIEWWWSLVVMVGFFAIGYLIFLSGLFGGGDVKLMIVLSLWIGWQPQALIAFGLWTALAGGALAVVIISLKLIHWLFIKVRKLEKKKGKGDDTGWRYPMPYGLAIAYAFGYLIWSGQIKGLTVPENISRHVTDFGNSILQAISTSIFQLAYNLHK